MIVIADTGPLRYLIEADAIHALPLLYGTVLTTPQVMSELRFDHFPPQVQQWAGHCPNWLRVEPPRAVTFRDRLDEGEASVLSLARERGADLVLIDERLATDLARGLGLEVMGTLGVLREGGARGHVDFESAVRELTAGDSKFRHTPELIEDARQRYQSLLRELRMTRDQPREDRGRER